MSANVDGGNYYDKSKVKKLINVSDESTKYDEVIDQLGENSNRYTSDLLFKYVENSDALTDADKAGAENIANYRTAKLYKLRQADYEGVKEWKACQKDAETAMISRLESDDDNPKSVTVSVASSYRTSPLKLGI